MECHCKKKCDTNCLNRLLSIECSPTKCKLGKSCTNTAIQNKKVAPIEIFQTAKKGLGIRAKQFIKKNTFINEYTVIISTEKAFLIRLKSDYVNYVHHYCMNFERGLVIDAYKMGNEMRFVNHSCNPNCVIEKWLVKGISRMCLFSKQDIQAGTELTFDYKFARYNSREIGQKCLCSSLNCSGIIERKSEQRLIKTMR